LSKIQHGKPMSRISPNQKCKGNTILGKYQLFFFSFRQHPKQNNCRRCRNIYTLCHSGHFDFQE
jgi:hypothetical protein